ncbi:methyl-accepting chemotaxis protein [Massilia niastensis]|uniref:methyl-accepting chemotaxis protein n=1 Tax=Massilia niastensis TaxID=544911 RepID=UPI000375A46D|nr:methyl-accepting chemotaxis protein [Massilia niastensis]
MLARLRIGPKLLLAPGAVLLLLVLLSWAAYVAMVRQNGSLESIVGRRATGMRAAASLAVQSQKAHADIYRLLSWVGGSFPAARTEPLRRDILVQHSRIQDGFDALARATAPGSERGQVEQAGAAHRAYARAVRDVIDLAPLDGSIGANAMLKAEGAFTVVAQRLAELAAIEETLSRQAASRARADFRLIALLMPAVVLLAIALSLAITFAVRRRLLAEIHDIKAAASGLASGDLTVRERSYGDDEIGDTARALDASIRNLNGTLRGVLDCARLIGAASRDIKLGNLSLGSRAVYRAGAMTHAAGSMQELAATVSLTADSALAANQAAAAMGSALDQGGGVVERLVATLESGKRSAQRVVEIVDQLDLVAGETGTLALNAALDAARAAPGGPCGAAGVAAVASGVRALARRVAAASTEIRALAAQSVAEIDGGAAWAAQAGNSMDRIAGAVRQVEDIVNRIGAASAGQASGLLEVNQAIVRMDQVTRQNSGLVEEAAAAARTLQLQALALSRAVAGFRLGEPDGVADAPPAPSKENGGPPRELPRERRRHPASHLWLASSRK